MGGDATSPASSVINSTDESSLDQNFPAESVGSLNFLSGDQFVVKVDENEEVELVSTNFEEFALPSSNSLDGVNQKNLRNVYMDVRSSYNELKFRKKYLKDAKEKILCYTPGSWFVEDYNRWAYKIPTKTILLLIGPKGSGKSSLINKISRVFEDDPFSPERAQVSYSSVGDGTCFVQEYNITTNHSEYGYSGRKPTNFSLYDTRSLSDDLTENVKMVKRLMTKGVRNGEPMTRGSDDVHLKSKLKSRSHQSNYRFIIAKPVNFVIFVVNAVSVMELMDNDDQTKTRQSQALASTFNNPLLSFKDDKPVVALTHGDLLSLSDRARIRMYLGRLLGVHPRKQIFDIPDGDDSGTELTILDMLRHCLELADRNLPIIKDLPYYDECYDSNHHKKFWLIVLAFLCQVICAGVWSFQKNASYNAKAPPAYANTDWNATTVNSEANFNVSGINSEANLNATAVNSEANLNASGINSEANFNATAVNSEANLNATAVNSVPDSQPEVSESDVDIEWGAIRHLWLNTN